MKAWRRVMIPTPHGEVSGIAPIIISASRATDIPAFYSDWFFERLKAGYLKWINPFNRKAQYISLAEVRVIVFWTKNPAPIFKKLDELERNNINYYFTVTLNDYEDDQLEPGIPPLEKRIEAFMKLSEKIGKERVIWRFDPLLLTESLGPERLLEKVSNVGTKIYAYTKQLVISFADIENYAKVKAKLARNDVRWLPFDDNSINYIAQGLQQINRKWGLEIKTCGEEYDLSAYDIKHNSCIDGNLMRSLFYEDHKLMNFLGVPEITESSLFPESNTSLLNEQELNYKLKDPGQRLACGCIMSKDIGQYDTCVHQCKYCYANTSDKVAQYNQKNHCIFSDSII